MTIEEAFKLLRNDEKDTLDEAKGHQYNDIRDYIADKLDLNINRGYCRDCEKVSLNWIYSPIFGNEANVVGGYIGYNDWYGSEETALRRIPTLKNLGIRNVKQKKRDHRVEFMMTPEEIANIRAQMAAHHTEVENAYNAELDAADIDRYRPTDAIINKLETRRQSGHPENVKAIKTIDKLFTYYYAAKIMGWEELMDAIRWTDLIRYEGRDEAEQILDAIDRRVEADQAHQETRSEDEVFLQQTFPRVYNYLRQNNSRYTFEKDPHNRRIYVLSMASNTNDVEARDTIQIRYTGRNGAQEWEVRGPRVAASELNKGQAEQTIIQCIENIQRR